MSQRLAGKPGVSSLLATLLGWTLAFFGLPIGAFFGGREYGLTNYAAAIVAVAAVQLVLVAFAVFAYRVNFGEGSKQD